VKYCYIAGPMRGHPDLNSAAFNRAANKMRLAGWFVFNPAAANLEGWPLRKILCYELTWICEQADAIAMLPGWSMSEGANAEYFVAKACGLEIIYLEDE
jgi:Domain of unknown function (DUF4406)